MICRSLRVVVSPGGTSRLSCSWTSRTVLGPRSQSTRRMASSESVGRGGCRSLIMVSSYTQPIIRSFSLMSTKSFVCLPGGHQKRAFGERGVERFAIVVAIEDGRLPREEIAVRVLERCEIVDRIALHPFVDEEQVRPGDRLVVQLG